MRAWVLTLVSVLLAAPTEAQGVRAATVDGDEPITVAARVRHVNAIVLPETAEIVEAVAGDAEQWGGSAAAHLAFVRPLAEGARSNAVLLTAAGRIVPLALVEGLDSAVDAVVRIGAAGAGAVDGGPVLAAAGAVEVAATRAAKAWEGSRRGGDAGSRAGRGGAVRRAGQARRGPRGVLPAGAVRYRWPAEAAGYPWMVEGMWHDDRRTYLRTRALYPLLYERVGGELEPVTAVETFDDVLHVVPRVLGAGALEVGGRLLLWTASPREAGPRWRSGGSFSSPRPAHCPGT